MVSKSQGHVAKSRKDLRLDQPVNVLLPHILHQEVHDVVAIGEDLILNVPANVAQDSYSGEADLPFEVVGQTCVEVGRKLREVLDKHLAHGVGKGTNGKHRLLVNSGASELEDAQESLHDRVGKLEDGSLRAMVRHELVMDGSY